MLMAGWLEGAVCEEAVCDGPADLDADAPSLNDGAGADGLKMSSSDTGRARDTSALVEEFGNRSPCEGVWLTAGACGRAKKASNVIACALECSMSKSLKSPGRYVSSRSTARS